MVHAKPRKKGRGAASDQARAGSGERGWLRERTDRRFERRFTPKTRAGELTGVLLTSFGSLLCGAGVFAQFLREVGPHPYAPYLLGFGPLLFLIGLVLGGKGVEAVRVGDAGIALERAADVERLGWFEVEAAELRQNKLTFSGHGKVLEIPVTAHPDAAALALRQARERIPARVQSITETLAGEPEAGVRSALEPPQLAGLRCAASDRLISFEADARLCGRCGQAYHREAIPERCRSCDARL